MWDAWKNRPLPKKTLVYSYCSKKHLSKQKHGRTESSSTTGHAEKKDCLLFEANVSTKNVISSLRNCTSNIEKHQTENNFVFTSGFPEAKSGNIRGHSNVNIKIPALHFFQKPTVFNPEVIDVRLQKWPTKFRFVLKIQICYVTANTRWNWKQTIIQLQQITECKRTNSSDLMLTREPSIMETKKSFLGA